MSSLIWKSVGIKNGNGKITDMDGKVMFSDCHFILDEQHQFIMDDVQSGLIRYKGSIDKPLTIGKEYYLILDGGLKIIVWQKSNSEFVFVGGLIVCS